MNSDIWNDIWSWLVSVNAGWYLLTGFIAIMWAMLEVATTYEEEAGRALRTKGAFFLMLVNAVLACLALGASLQLLEGPVSVWLALGVGFGWQAILRSGINIQPLPLTGGQGHVTAAGEEAEAGEKLGIPLDEFYARVQRLSRRQINRDIVNERVELVSEAVDKLAVDDLVYEARVLMGSFPPAAIEGDPQAFIDRIRDSDRPDELKEMMLISLILEYGGRGALKRILRKNRSKSPQTQPA